MGATRGVMAQDSKQDGNDLLLKILKEKNILTEQQFQDIKGQLLAQRNDTQQKLTALDRSVADYLAKAGDTVGGSDTYVKNQGVTFSSGDGMWSIFFGGLFQFGYEYESGDNVDSHGGFAVFENRFDFGGTIFDPNLKFYTQLQTTHIDSNNYYLAGADQSMNGLDYVYGDFVNVLDAYVDWRFSDMASLEAGQFKIPYGRQSLTDASDLAFTYRSVPANYFRAGYQGRDMGVMLHSTVSDQNDPNALAWEWAAGLWNGSGDNLGYYGSTGGDTWLAWGLRGAVYPFGAVDYVEGDWNTNQDPKFGIGGSFLFDETHNTSGGDNPKTTAWEVDGVLKWMGIFAEAEYFSSKYDNGSNDYTDTGWYLQGGYFLIPGQLEVLGRYGMIDYDNNDQTSEWALGGAWYFDGHEWKIVGSVGQTKYDPDGGSSMSDWFIDFTFQADW
jgi:hypothetical protein